MVRGRGLVQRRSFQETGPPVGVRNSNAVSDSQTGSEVSLSRFLQVSEGNSTVAVAS